MNIYAAWAKAAGIRAVKTFGQVAASAITLGPATDFIHVGWGGAFSLAGVAAVLSLLTSLAGLPEVPKEENPV